MGFKPKTAKINISLDMSEYLKESDPKGDILPKKIPKVKEYITWAKEATKVIRDKEEEERLNDPEYAVNQMIKQIDYWYEKGTDWWKERCTFPVLKEVLDYLSEKVAKVQKK